MGDNVQTETSQSDGIQAAPAPAPLSPKERLEALIQSSQELIKQMDEHKIPDPTFSANCQEDFASLPPETITQRFQLLDLLSDVALLVHGPAQSITDEAQNAMADSASLNILNYFNFWDAVPLEGDASFEEISKSVRLPQEAVQTVLRYAMNNRIFEMVNPTDAASRIRHTSRSAVMVREKSLRFIVSLTIDGLGGPLAILNRSLEKYFLGKTELSNEISETPFGMLYNEGGPLGKFKDYYDFIDREGEGEKKGWRQRDMVESLRLAKEKMGAEGALLDALDWAGAGKATVVDLGGSGGHDDVPLAEHFPDLTIVVQDLPSCQAKFDDGYISDELKKRISFVAHDFFTPQPIQAEIYLFKWVFYDWSPKEITKIIKALIPALKPGARILVLDLIVDISAEAAAVMPRSLVKYSNVISLKTLSLFGHTKQGAKKMTEIFQAADERFEVIRDDVAGTFMTFEAVWRG
ncbi:6-hydroxytryprostatin B O-methyltransferase [Tolypocladium ophioglossoides CBS 100239]|uniref:6-hydroxytryprostatin B O-methyltransferase n=1 Tax=Tolypocladium ophioglossoides (strain CBS 100239) TaxID=1163406 RepID=A0A0L0MYC4_TOLOC|nr:6-hydroxytryprostatin B O-methyltransferase [Tolypocladium ophioglossoides CBS 100239]